MLNLLKIVKWALGHICKNDHYGWNKEEHKETQKMGERRQQKMKH